MTTIISVGLPDVAAQSSLLQIGDTYIDDLARIQGRISAIDEDAVREGDDAAEAIRAHQLPSIDGGAAAWRVLFGAFVFEALLWGTDPLSTGQKPTAHIFLQDSHYLMAFFRTTISKTNRFEATRTSRSWVLLPPV